MNLDQYKLPCQSNGDCNDQLQRVGMIAVGESLSSPRIAMADPVQALELNLQPEAGLYTRFTGSPTNDVTADQLIPAIAYWSLTANFKQSFYMFTRMCERLGFAQNTHKNGDPSTLTIPDFMPFRTLPLFLRASKLFYPLVWLADILLLFAAFFAVLPEGMDTVDDNNIIITLIVCRARMPTLISKLAATVYYKHRAINYGVTKMGASNNVAGALIWYHKASSGGNPEVGNLYLPLIERYLK